MRKIGVYLFAFAVLATSCNKDGCVDPTAINYDPNAENDDGSCVYLDENLSLSLYNKLGADDFTYGTEVISQSGRRVKFSRAQIYLSKFTFNGTGGPYELLNPHLLIKANESDYSLGYLPADSYTSFSFATGVDSVSNYADPASFSTESALSSNNPDHMHWSWNTGYIFYVLEGMVDTSASMAGPVNAPFIFHVGTDQFLQDLAFVTDINSSGDDVNIELEVDWLKLLDGINMTAADSTRSTHTMNNPQLASMMVSNVEDAFRLN